MKTRPFPLFVFLTIFALLTPGKVQPSVARAQPIPFVAPASAPDVARVSAALSHAPVMFIENAGQLAEGARFQARGGNGTIWLAEDAIWITVLEKPSSPRPPSPKRGEGGEQLPSPNGRGVGGEGDPRHGVHLRLSFPGANPHPLLEPFDRLDTHVSYFIGSDPAQWRADVPVWGGVRYRDLYPGLDLEITGEGGQIVQRLICNANCQFALQQVRLQVDGADSLALLPTPAPSLPPMLGGWGGKPGVRANSPLPMSGEGPGVRACACPPPSANTPCCCFS